MSIALIKLRKLRWAGYVARVRQTRSACEDLVGKSEGNRPFEIPNRRWEVNIELDLKEIKWEDEDWIRLAC
jgi:hypothetical protein